MTLVSVKAEIKINQINSTKQFKLACGLSVIVSANCIDHIVKSNGQRLLASEKLTREERKQVTKFEKLYIESYMFWYKQAQYNNIYSLCSIKYGFTGKGGQENALKISIMNVAFCVVAASVVWANSNEEEFVIVEGEALSLNYEKVEIYHGLVSRMLPNNKAAEWIDMMADNKIVPIELDNASACPRMK